MAHHVEAHSVCPYGDAIARVEGGGGQVVGSAVDAGGVVDLDWELLDLDVTGVAFWQIQRIASKDFHVAQKPTVVHVGEDEQFLGAVQDLDRAKAAGTVAESREGRRTAL